MLVLLLTMRTWWYKEGVGRAAGGGRDRRRLGRRRAAFQQERAEGPNLHIIAQCAGCRGRGLGGEAVDGVIAPSTDHRPREEKLMARSSIMEWVRA